MTKYVDAEKLKSEIERQQRNLDVLSLKGDNVQKRYAAVQNGAYVHVLSLIDSIQQEQPEVDLEKELEQYARNHPADDPGSYRNLIGIARHFYELGQQNKYQQDRAEFAKLKAKEWQDGYDDGYQRGLNARKEE